MKNASILLLFLTLLCGLSESAYSQKAKYKNGILTGPNNEYKAKLAYILGKPKVVQTKLEQNSILVTVTDDQCRTYGIQNTGKSSLNAEEWAEKGGFSAALQDMFKGDTLQQSTFDTHFGRAVLYTFTAKNSSPCMEMTFPGDGTRTVSQPDADAGIAFLNVNGIMYGFLYFVDKNPPSIFYEEKISDVAGMIKGLISSFTPQPIQ